MDKNLILGAIIVLLPLVWAFVSMRKERTIKKCFTPGCDYKGKAIRKIQGSQLVGLILCLFYLLPGIIYFLCYYKETYHCPKCDRKT